MSRTILIIALLLAASVHADINRIAGGGASGGSVATNAPVDARSLEYAPMSLVLTDQSRNVVQAIGADGVLADVLGTTLAEQAGKPLAGVASQVSMTPSGVAATSEGDVYVVAGRRVLRVVPPMVEVFTEPGGGVDLLSPTGADASAFHLYVADPSLNRVLRYPLACAGPRCQPDRIITGLALPYDVQVSEDGALVYVLEQGGRVKRVAADGSVTLVAGGGTDPGSGVAALSARFSTPTGFCLAPTGELYVADSGQRRLAKIAGGIVTTVAGTGQAQNPGAWVTSTAPLSQPLTRPYDCAVSRDGKRLAVSVADDKRVYVLDLATGAITPTATHSPRPTDTAAPTVTRTRTPVPPTATATIRPCAPGEAPSCQGPTL